jgi:hypothetical protein
MSFFKKAVCGLMLGGTLFAGSLPKIDFPYVADIIPAQAFETPTLQKSDTKKRNIRLQDISI